MRVVYKWEKVMLQGPSSQNVSLHERWRLRKVGVLKLYLISKGLRKEWVYHILALLQQFTFSSFHFRALQNLHLLLSGLFKFMYRVT